MDVSRLQIFYTVAGCVSIATAIAHSVLGEILIFQHLRVGGLVPTLAPPPLRKRHLGILWATWHLASVFGLAFAGVLFGLARGDGNAESLLVNAIVWAHFGGAALVLVGTRGRHPGWIALALVAVLVWWAARGG